jgi:hypothetical protein
MASQSAAGSITDTGTTAYEGQPLDASTWDAFAGLVERNHGIFGGC